MRASVSIVAIITCLALPALGQDRARFPTVASSPGPLQALETVDQTRGWEAVGRLDTGVGFCTATLISEDIILTAAHCLYDEQAARLGDAQLIFNAGLRIGRPDARRGIARSLIHPDYEYGLPDDLSFVRSDLAILQLESPIRDADIRPFATNGVAIVGDGVQVVSYGEDRADVASLEDDCQVLAQDLGVLVLSCHVVRGSSGAPIFLEYGGEMNVVSVVSARAQWRDEPVALSAELQGELDVMLDLLADQQAILSQSLPQVRRLGGDNTGRDNIGARFVRP
jgi:protease YdgD